MRHVVGKALKRETPEITIWGRHRPFELNRRVASVHHQLSSAARIFKAKALAAVAIPTDSVEPVETFGRARRNPRVAADSFCQRHPHETGVNAMLNAVSSRVLSEG